MNVKHLATAIFTLISVSTVSAQEYVVPSAGFVSTKTRAKVIEELKQARADGSLKLSDHDYPKIKFYGPPRSRAEVQQEVTEARAVGTLEISETTYPNVPDNGSRKTRAQVRMELEEHQRNRPLNPRDDIYFG